MDRYNGLASQEVPICRQNNWSQPMHCNSSSSLIHTSHMHTLTSHPTSIRTSTSYLTHTIHLTLAHRAQPWSLLQTTTATHHIEPVTWDTQHLRVGRKGVATGGRDHTLPLHIGPEVFNGGVVAAHATALELHTKGEDRSHDRAGQGMLRAQHAMPTCCWISSTALVTPLAVVVFWP